MRSIAALRAKTLNFSVRQLGVESRLLDRVSVWTIYRVMRKLGFSWSTIRRKGVLSPLDKRNRAIWCRRHSKLPISYWRRVAIYLDGVSFLYKKNPREAARTARTKGWLKRSEKLQHTTKGQHEHDSKSRSLHFLQRSFFFFFENSAGGFGREDLAF